MRCARSPGLARAAAAVDGGGSKAKRKREVRALAARGAALGAETEFGDTPLSLAERAGHVEVAQLLLTLAAGAEAEKMG